MANEKVIGYILLAVGLVVIAFAGINIILVFTRQIPPVQLFNFQGISVDAGKLIDPNARNTGANLQLIAPEMINQTSNIFAHLFLMGFIASLGFKVANLGVSLARTIEVKVRGKEVAEK